MPNITQLHSDGNKWISKKNGSNNIPYTTFHIKFGNPQIYRICKLNRLYALHTGASVERWKNGKPINYLVKKIPRWTKKYESDNADIIPIKNRDL